MKPYTTFENWNKPSADEAVLFAQDIMQKNTLVKCLFDVTIITINQKYSLAQWSLDEVVGVKFRSDHVDVWLSDIVWQGNGYC